LKDGLGVFVLGMSVVYLISLPFVLGDGEIFVKANFLVSPRHIVPEWYFLFAYAILRAIPDKVLGVLGLVFSVGVLFLLVFSSKCIVFDKVNKLCVLFLGFAVVVLT